LTIYHLTDLHLFANADARLKGVPTRETLGEILGLVRSGLASDDVIVITGDLAHDELEPTYAALRELLGDLVGRCWFLPGNHDDRRFIRKVFADRVPGGERVNFAFDHAGWRVIGLDSQIPGEVPGRVGEAQLDWLAGELRQGSTPVVLFLHHPPVPVGSAWVDRLGLEDATELHRVIDASGRVKHIYAGHVHQDVAVRLGSTPVTTTPSTGVQFQPGADEFATDPIPPGFRVIRLAETGCTSEVVRAAALRYPPDV
jgi:Icc protein